jgi:hypothetical protein
MLLSRADLRPKFTDERVKCTFDFASLLTNDESLSSATTTAAVYAGADASPSALISGAATISGSVVTQLIIGGTAGVIYQIDCKAVTSASQTLVLTSRLAVILEAS